MQRSNVRFNASSKSAVQAFTPRLRLAMLASAMAFALLGASAAMAQTAAAPAKAGEQKAYVPDVGQEGKDVFGEVGGVERHPPIMAPRRQSTG